MSLLDRVQTDLVSAMKAKQEARLSTLRMMKAALQKYTIDTMKPLDDAAEQQILKSMVKQRHDSADAFRKGGREELAEKEDSERALIESFMPAFASDADLDEAVSAAIADTGATAAKQMGLVIKAAQTKLAGKTIDGKILSEKVKAKLQ
jgi:uncharacterized protein YqeY